MRVFALLGKLQPGFQVGPVLGDLMSELYRDAFTISASGSAPVGSSTLDDVTEWLAPNVAGAAVGCTGRRVRQLCNDGVVRSQRIDGRTLLVDVADLRRHFRGRAA